MCDGLSVIMKTTCNCWLGILNSYDQSESNDLRINTIVEQLNERSELSKRLSIEFDRSFMAFAPKDYIDRRRGLAKLFNYCPLCGKKIEWKGIRKKF